MKTRLHALLASLFLCLMFPLAALALPQGLAKVTEVEGITEYRLANGLQVLLAPDASKPTTTVNLTYRVGSRHENYGETGMAHLLEHLIFKGTPTTRNALAEFTRRGMQANGTTSFDRTNYFASWSANDENLRWYLAWQADAMVNSFIAKADLDTEMTVVRNEMEIGENNAMRMLVQQVMAAMFNWHNYGKTTIGARSDVENVRIERLQAFYRRHYQPDNATLIVSGKFDAERTLQWIAESFGPLPRPERMLEPQYTLEAAQDGERTVTLRRVGGNPALMVGYHMPSGAHPDFAAVQVLAQVLGDTPGGRLHRRLVTGQMAAGTFGFAWGLAEPGPLMLGVQLAPGQDLERARREALAVIDGMSNEPVTAEELERARTQLLNAWDQTFADPEAIGVQLSSAIALGDWRLFFLDRDWIRKVTLADVNRVAADHLRPDNRTVGSYVPTPQPQRAPAPQRADVTALVKDYRGQQQLAAVEAFDPTPANLDARTRFGRLPSGMRVALLPKGARGQTVHARLRLNYGDLASLTGTQPAGQVLASMLTKGGAGLTRQQISDRLDQLRAEVSFGAEGQALVATVQTRRDQLPEVIALLGRLLREPALPADALQEVRRQMLAGIERQRSEPAAIVARELERHGNPYPRGDLRYAPTFDEQVQDLQALTVERLREYHRRFYSAAHAEFAATGDMDVAAVEAALRAAFGDWSAPAAGGAAAFVRVPQPWVERSPKRFVSRTPDKQNAEMRLVLPLPVRELDAEHAALMVANQILGAGPASRMWERMRERDGLTYNVFSGIAWNPYEANSRFIMVVSFAPQFQGRIEAAMSEEIERARREGFAKEEFEKAREGLLRERRLARAQDDAVASGLLRNLTLERRFAAAQQLDDALARLTVEDVNAALRKHLDPARWSAAWAGDFKETAR